MLKPVRFTPRELDIMAVLWERGPSTVAEVREHLSDDLAHNTVLTMLGILEAKGYVRHTEEGRRAHRYHVLVGHEQAGMSIITRIIDKVFGGSTERFFASVIRERRLSEAEALRLRELLDHVTEHYE